MKKLMKVCFIILFVMSLAYNGLMCYYFYNINKPSPSVVKVGFDEYEIYCERSEDVEFTHIDLGDGSIKIGNAELVREGDLFLVSPHGKINLSQKGGDAFVINSDGALLYQLIKPEKEITATVFATPSGKKYHKDAYCAGRTAFEVPLETAMLFDREPCKICS